MWRSSRRWLTARPDRSGTATASSDVSRNDLDDVPFAPGQALREAIERKRPDIEVRVLAGDQIREDPAGGRRVLEAVAAEAGDREEAVDVTRRPDDRVVVG